MEDDARIFRLFIIIIIIDRFSFCSFHFVGLVSLLNLNVLVVRGVHSTCFVGIYIQVWYIPHTHLAHLYVCMSEL